MTTGNIDEQDDPLATLGGLLFNRDADDNDPNDASAMTLVDHLEELRRRIFKSLIAIVLFAIVAFFFREYIMAFLTWPLPAEADALAKHGQKLVVSGIGKGFSTFLMLS